MGRKRASPWPSSFSAPTESSTTRESVAEEVAKAMREGTLALMRPVTTLTEGRWVASTRWMPAARELGDAHDAVLDIPGGDHHQVSQLVDDHQQVGIRAEHALGVGRQLDLSGAHRLVEVVDVLVAEVGEVVVPVVHLLDDPFQRLGGLLGVGDDGRDQVRMPS